MVKPTLVVKEDEKKNETQEEQGQEEVEEERHNLIPELETVAPNNTNQSNVIPALPPGDPGVAEASQGENRRQTDRQTDRHTHTHTHTHTTPTTHRPIQKERPAVKQTDTETLKVDRNTG